MRALNDQAKPQLGRPEVKLLFRRSGYVYRFGVGDYLIVYRINESQFEVLVLDAKPRGEVYKSY
jgi:mRNA-degrading endonuclease RelE of RelBE toxin-antitoxin system